MNKIVYIIALVLMCGWGTNSYAQKVGYTSADVILANIDEAKKINNQLEELRKTLEDRMSKAQKGLEVLVMEIQKNGNTWPPVVLEQKQKEFQTKRAETEALGRQLDQEFTKKQQELLQPLLNKVNETIKKVAIDNGYDFIVNAQTGTLPILLSKDPKDDITNKVIEILGGTKVESK